MAHETHRIPIGGPSYIRSLKRVEIEAERIASFRLPEKRDGWRSLAVYQAGAERYFVAKSGGIPYLGEEFFCYFLRPGEDPEAALEYIHLSAKQGKEIPREEWPKYEPRLTRPREPVPFTRQEVDALTAPYLGLSESEAKQAEAQLVPYVSYWMARRE
jgi:hypothetical protein